MIAIHGIGARTEQQECACPICSFGLALGEALVADEAPCWSPTRPASGTPLSAPYARLPYTPLVETRRARIDSRRPKKRRSTGSHSSVRMLSNNVRDALVTSLMCWPALTPPSRFYLKTINGVRGGG